MAASSEELEASADMGGRVHLSADVWSLYLYLELSYPPGGEQVSMTGCRGSEQCCLTVVVPNNAGGSQVDGMG